MPAKKKSSKTSASKSKSKTKAKSKAKKEQPEPKADPVEETKSKAKSQPEPKSSSTLKSPPPMASNLHPEKLTYDRFSDRMKSLDDDNMSIGRLLLYIIIVVIIGVGLTLGVQAYIRNQNEQNQIAEQQQEEEPVVTSVDVSTLVQPDDLAAPILAETTVFSSEVLSLDGVTSEESDAADWQELAYRRYNSAERMIFTFADASNVPAAEVSYDSEAQTVSLVFTPATTSKEDLAAGEELVSVASDTALVDLIQNASTVEDTLAITIYVSEDVLMYAQYDEEDFVLDLMQADVAIEDDSTADDQADDTVDDNIDDDTTATNGDRPAAPHYDNDYSKDTQYISSTYTGNDLRVWNYTYRDYGDRYEFKFRIKGPNNNLNAGKPNVKAYLNGDSADPRLIVEIENINWEILDNYLNAECFDGVGYGNVEKICGEFNAAENKVTYQIHLYNLADFEMDAVDNTPIDPERPGEVIWLKIKDN